MQSGGESVSLDEEDQCDAKLGLMKETRVCDLLTHISGQPKESNDVWMNSPKKRYLLNQQNQYLQDQNAERARNSQIERSGIDDDVALLLMSGKLQQASGCHRSVPSSDSANCFIDTDSLLNSSRWFTKSDNSICVDNSASCYSSSSTDLSQSLAQSMTGSAVTLAPVGNMFPVISEDAVTMERLVPVTYTPSRFHSTGPGQNFLHHSAYSNSPSLGNAGVNVNTDDKQYPLTTHHSQASLFSLNLHTGIYDATFTKNNNVQMQNLRDGVFEPAAEENMSQTSFRPCSPNLSVSQQSSTTFSCSEISTSDIENDTVLRNSVDVSNTSSYGDNVEISKDKVTDTYSRPVVLNYKNCVQMEMKLPSAVITSDKCHTQGQTGVSSIDGTSCTRPRISDNCCSPVNSTITLEESHVHVVRSHTSTKLTDGNKLEMNIVGGPDSTTSCSSDILIGQQEDKESRSKSEASQLKCQVCGDTAAGFHCGAYVCEACKKFYIRTIRKEKIKYVCLKKKQCIVTKKLRTLCQYCRYQKCLQLGMYRPGDGPNSSVDSNIGVIPCRVCSAPSSGFHFGAITCEGCKGFFRRMIKEREANRYGCSKGGGCEITLDTRNMCKSCRYHKCIQVGMSAERSRIGRQPNAVKHATLLEMQSWMALVNTQPSTVTPEAESPDSKENDYQRETTPSIPSLSQTSFLGLPDFSKTSYSDSPTWKPSMQISLGSESRKTTQNSTPVNLQKPPGLFSTSNVTGCDQKPRNISQAKQETFHKYTVGFRQDTPRALSPLPPNKPLYAMLRESSPADVLKEIIAAGRELDSIPVRSSDCTELTEEDFQDLTFCWKKMMDHFTRHAHATLKFAKKIPGFRSLQLDDQASLLRTSIYPIIILSFAVTFEPLTRTFSYFNFSKEEMERIFRYIPGFIPLKQHFLTVGDMITLLKITRTELDFLKALILLCSDEGNLLEKDKAWELQENIAAALQEYEEKTHEDGGTRFGVMIARLAEFRLMNLQHHQIIGEIIRTHPYFEVPQLYSEFFFSNS